MEGGPVNHCWCIGVVSHSYGVLGGGKDGGGGGWQACWTKPGGVGRMSGDVSALPECDVKTLMKPDHTAFKVRCSG